MIPRLSLVLAASLLLLSCGVKTELDRPNPEIMQKNQNDPSRPPHPLGQSGGNDKPFPTGP